ncbi:MAG: bifunctional diaminohydroxyphosphoribosylaminopyrimidine deaminase/5-amino-6-(5-phosphoribosylamino)uracil reductase RibD [Burkholderiales bacterium]|jgi:diaminohydroxyphosphoribosylaminopyrimidine deaminase/5-amino-6-(5-phosphoribosylamino)uracil reductase|nr:bifunctional diaminohydroxyphosphoribosylaminopyrimidine deaminase/5-amino-6-(5-phosphoribosylamino)uracil reductase RibD [Nitrosomonadaceae bacterium]
MTLTNQFSAQDHAMMARAIQIAEQGRAITTPNPFVGCVIVKGGRIIGEGFTQAGGRPHAEAEALARCTESPKGATVYSTLEPCSLHAQSRGPACSDLLVEAGVARVVSALHDPFDGVDGKGHARLVDAGIELDIGLMAAQVEVQLKGFLSRVRRGRPWVTLKVAASLDGKTALDNGLSKWITSAEARRDVHAMRRDSCAVMTGIGTLLVDNPTLNVRDVPCTRQPLRVLLDSRLDVTDDANLLQGGNTLIVTATGSEARAEALRARGLPVERVATEPVKGKVDLAAMMQLLGSKKINTLMVETGAKLNGSLLQAGVVDEIVAYIAPSILGDDARGLFAIPALRDLADKIQLSFSDVRQIGPDLRITAKVVY